MKVIGTEQPTVDAMLLTDGERMLHRIVDDFDKVREKN